MKRIEVFRPVFAAANLLLTMGVANAQGDTTPPNVAFTSPTNLAAFTTLAAPTGTVSDASGVSSVAVYLSKPDSGGIGLPGYPNLRVWWNGTEFTRSRTALPALLDSPNHWIGTYTQPTSDDQYMLEVVATDMAGNVSVPVAGLSRIEIYLDNQCATPILTTPAHGTTLPSLTQITGTAHDRDPVSSSQEGCGVKNVYVYLYRGAGTPTGPEHWDASIRQWVVGVRYYTFQFNQTDEEDVSWSVPSSWLPTPSEMPDGNYRVRVRARDRAGNTSPPSDPPTVTHTITIDAP